jgi:glycogen operon protein
LQKDPNARSVAIYLDGADDPDRAADGTLLTDDDFLVLINAWWEPLDFCLPATRPDQTWHVEVDTYDPPAAAVPADTSVGNHITVQPRSILVLRAKQPKPNCSARSETQAPA